MESCGATEPLAAASDAARDIAGRVDLGDRAVERRAGAEPAGPLELRPRCGDVRRRADGDAGRTRRCNIPAAALCRSASRRLAGVSRARRPHPDRWTVVPAVGYRAGDAACRGWKYTGNRK